MRDPNGAQKKRSMYGSVFRKIELSLISLRRRHQSPS
jgi:hypothetical protein